MDTAHNPETGEFAIRFPGEGWRTVSEAEYGQARSSRIGNFAGAIADIAQDTAGFALDVAQPSFLGGSRFDVATGETRAGPGRQILQANDERQAARWASDPAMSLAGEVASVAMPGLPLVAPAAKGTARGLRIGGDVVNANRARQLSRADQGATLSGAPGASGGADLAAGSNLRDRVAQQVFRQSDPDQEAIKLADDVGFRLTPGQRRGSVSQQTMEEGFIRNPGAKDVWEREVAGPNQEQFTSILREGLGLERGSRITFGDTAKAEDAIYARFDTISDGMVGKKRITAHELDQMKRLGASDDADAEKSVFNRFIRNTDEKLNPDFAGDSPELWHAPGWTSWDAKTIWNRIRALNTAIGEAKGNEIDPLLKLRELHEDWFAELAGDQSKEVAQAVKEVNEQFRVLKVLQSPGVLKEDQPNVKILSNAIRRNFKEQARRNDYKDGRGRALEPSTTRLIKAAQVQQRFPEMLNNSGTPTGNLMSGDPAGVAAKLISSRAAAEMYFGNPLRSAGAAANTKVGAAAGGAAGLSLWAGGE